MIKFEYPESDGTPLAETDAHCFQMIDALIHPLRTRYRQQDDVYISGNLFFYYEEGNPRAVVAPDVFVVFGVPNKKRRTYKLWQEGEDALVETESILAETEFVLADTESVLEAERQARLAAEAEIERLKALLAQQK